MHQCAKRIVLAVFLLPAPADPQALPPGHVDPFPVLDAAAEAMGVDQLRCVSFSGEGYAGMVGQNITQNTDWPRGEALRAYSRKIDFRNGVSVERFSRKPGMNPASWKYGPGWLGGTPLQRHERQTFAVSGRHAWHADGPGRPVPAPRSAELWQLDMWMTPHGFVRAARMPGANPTAIWRWELGESGRDGATTGGIPRVFVVSATVLGKYRVNATVREGHLVQRTQTRVPHPVLGDMNYEHEFSEWTDLGDGILFPAGWHRHDGWDDERQVPLLTGGHNSFGGSFPDMTANDCEQVSVPAEVLSAAPTPTPSVVPTVLAEGVWLLGGGTHNSVAVEFSDFVAVVEAPLDERRSLAVIDKVVELVPDKPIRFLVNTHDHYDHLGGIRTYLHVGATIVTHQRNRMFYESELLNYVPRMLEPDMVSLYPPTEISEGYTMEDVDEKYILGDGERFLEIFYVQGLGVHVEGMLMAYLPRERILIQADLYDPGLLPEDHPRPTQEERVLLRNARQNGLRPETVAPIHGDPTAWGDFLRETRQEE